MRARNLGFAPLTVALAVVLVLASGCASDKSSSSLGTAPTGLSPMFGSQPASPTGLSVAKVDSHGFLMTWLPNEGVVDGYLVYRYDPSPDRVEAYAVQTLDLLTTTRYVFSGGNPGDRVYVRVSAVRAGSGESAQSEPLEVVLASLTPEPTPESPPEVTGDGPEGRGGPAVDGPIIKDLPVIEPVKP